MKITKLFIITIFTMLTLPQHALATTSSKWPLSNAIVGSALTITAISGATETGSISSSNTSVSDTGSTSRPVRDFFIRLSICLLLAALAIGLFFGLTDRAIFYRDTADFFFCFVPLAGFAVIHLIFSFLLNITSDWVNTFAIAVTALLLLYVIYRSCLMNNANYFVGTTVGVAKVALGLFAFVQLNRVISPGGSNQSEKRNDRFVGAIMLMLSTWLITRLVNGERVLAARRDISGSSAASDI